MSPWILAQSVKQNLSDTMLERASVKYIALKSADILEELLNEIASLAENHSKLAILESVIRKGFTALCLAIKDSRAKYAVR